jgi:aspartate racemase
VIKAAGLRKIGLLGTRFTMEQDFYKGRLIDKHGLRVIVPDEADRETVHRVIYAELCLGIVRLESREQFIEIINSLVQAGAEGIILGCTEIELLVHAGDSPVPLFPTARLHAVAAVENAIT